MLFLLLPERMRGVFSLRFSERSYFSIRTRGKICFLASTLRTYYNSVSACNISSESFLGGMGIGRCGMGKAEDEKELDGFDSSNPLDVHSAIFLSPYSSFHRAYRHP